MEGYNIYVMPIQNPNSTLTLYIDFTFLQLINMVTLNRTIAFYLLKTNSILQ